MTNDERDPKGTRRKVLHTAHSHLGQGSVREGGAATLNEENRTESELTEGSEGNEEEGKRQN